MLLSTLSAQFPRSCGLKFRAPESSARSWRGVRLADGKLFQPPDTGWSNIVFVCVTPRAGDGDSLDRRRVEEGGRATQDGFFTASAESDGRTSPATHLCPHLAPAMTMLDNEF